METLRKAYYFFVNSNLMIALAAVAQCALTYLILHRPVDTAILWIEGGTTLLLYNLSLFLSMPKEPLKSPFQRTRWLARNWWVFYTLCAIAGLFSLYGLSQVHWFTWVYLALIGLFSLAYAVPIFRFHGKWMGLRQIPGLKIFHIAIIWSLSSVGLPVVELTANGIPVDWFLANYLGIVKILFLLICTLPFDIRDYEQDQIYHLKTIPTLLGKSRSIRISYILGIWHILLMLFSPFDSNIKYAMILTTTAILILMRLQLFGKNKHYHAVYLLDLALIVQWLLVYLFLNPFDNLIR